MARRSVRALALMMLTVALVAAPLWATHRSEDLDNPSNENVIHEMTYKDMAAMMVRLQSLLPVARVRNLAVGRTLQAKGTLKWVTTLPITQFTMPAGNVNFRPGWHPKRYSTMSEDVAMFQLGLLAGYGHFAIVNANIPEIRESASTILGELDTITSGTMLTDMNADIKQVAQAVADTSYPGGPTKTLDAFDKWTLAMATRIRDQYMMDGFWYYSAGIDLAGLSSLSQTDSYNAPYFRNFLEMLYNHEPSTGLPYPARYHMAQILRLHAFHGHNFGSQVDHAMGAITAILPPATGAPAK